MVSKIIMPTKPAFPFLGQKQRFFAISNCSYLVIVFVVIVVLGDYKKYNVTYNIQNMS